jgi:hypothetical protein
MDLESDNNSSFLIPLFPDETVISGRQFATDTGKPRDLL